MRFRPRRYAHRSLANELAALLHEHVMPDLQEQAVREGETWDEDELIERGAIWILGALFVRVLEDRGLMEPRCRGLFATDEELTEEAIGELAAAMRAIGDRLGAAWWGRGEEGGGPAPSAGCLDVIGRVLYQTDERGELRWRFERRDGQVWDDVYQGLSERLRKRYGLVSTPAFVAEFMADRALEQASDAFALDAVRVLDPACGAGNLLLAVFARLLAHDRAGTGKDDWTHARAALERIHGVDLCAYAVVMAQFRLLLAVVDAMGVERLAEVPGLPLHLAVGDSLAHGGVQLRFGFLEQGDDADILRRRYHVVITEPPALADKSRDLRGQYRSVTRRAALTAPFVELCLQTAAPGGAVSVLASRSFATRDFGKPLVEDVLARVDLRCVIDLSGAYVPGHGAPLLMLVARAQPPRSDRVHMVFCRRGESIAPKVPAQGQVWSAIRESWRRIDDDDAWISVQSVPRTALGEHPWMFAADIYRLWSVLERNAGRPLGDVAVIRQGALPKEDDLFVMPRYTARRLRLQSAGGYETVAGVWIRDWAIQEGNADEARIALLPFAEKHIEVFAKTSAWNRYLWPYRAYWSESGLAELQTFWQWFSWEAHSWSGSRCYLTPSRTRYPRFASLDDCDVVWWSALAIKPAVTETQFFALLAYLNSSVVSFFLMNRAESSGSEYRIAAQDLAALPVPGALFDDHEASHQLAALGRTLHETAGRALGDEPHQVLADWHGETRASLLQAWSTAEQRRRARSRAMVYLQEEVDWRVYALLGLVDEPDGERAGRVWPEDRPFAWLAPTAPTHLPAAIAERWQRRRDATRHSRILTLLERAEYKRPWTTLSRTRRDADFRAGMGDACRQWLLARIEDMAAEERAVSVQSIMEKLLREERTRVVLEVSRESADIELVALVTELVAAQAVPYLAAQRYSDSGMKKRVQWERHWVRERRRDAGLEDLEDRPVMRPPTYQRRDFTEERYWHVRGRLDIARERFISYPEAETRADPTLVFSLATGDHAARARALVELYARRKELLKTEALALLLAGALELVPWLRQWHAGSTATVASADPEELVRFVSREARELGVSMGELLDRAALRALYPQGL